jgi:uncharacterized damage-inducible protein DinB
MTRPNDVLRSMFDHHLWATGRLIDHLEGLSSARLDQAVPGTFGSMSSTLIHLIDADSRYLQRLESPSPPAREDRVDVSLATLREEMPTHRRGWNDMLERLERGDLHAAVRGKAGYPDTEDAEAMLLLQAIHHGNDHRTQISSTLGALGEDVPDLDGWTFWVEGR